jgi:hypothetical protein
MLPISLRLQNGKVKDLWDFSHFVVGLRPVLVQVYDQNSTRYARHAPSAKFLQTPTLIEKSCLLVLRPVPRLVPFVEVEVKNAALQ